MYFIIKYFRFVYLFRASDEIDEYGVLKSFESLVALLLDVLDEVDSVDVPLDVEEGVSYNDE